LKKDLIFLATEKFEISCVASISICVDEINPQPILKHDPTFQQKIEDLALLEMSRNAIMIPSFSMLTIF
jgi:hypothetical protein